MRRFLLFLMTASMLFVGCDNKTTASTTLPMTTQASQATDEIDALDGAGISKMTEVQQSTSFTEVETVPTETVNTEVSSEPVKTTGAVEQTETVVPTEVETVPIDDAVESDSFIVMKDVDLYTYDNMCQDIYNLCRLYPNYVSYESLAETDDGRNIFHITIGDENAEHSIFINAGIHAREYITCQIAMKQCVSFVQKLACGDEYNGVKYADLISNCSIHFVPMINPDGVTLSQLGLSGLNKPESVDKVENIAKLDGKSTSNSSYLETWKANINGVDINRNFDGGWDRYEDSIGHPSSDHYKGESAESEIETQALLNITRRYMFDYIVCYHAQGGEIYWYYGEEGEALKRVEALRDALTVTTGYWANEEHHYTGDAACYRDWTAGDMKLVSATVEMGRDYCPVDPEQLPEIWSRCKNIVQEVCVLVNK